MSSRKCYSLGTISPCSTASESRASMVSVPGPLGTGEGTDGNLRNRPLRVLHVVRVMNRGGAETLIVNLYRELSERNVQFDVVVTTQEPGVLDSEVSKLGGRIFVLPDPRRLRFIGFVRAFYKTLVNQGPYDAVHSHVFYFSGVILAIAAVLGVPVRIAHSHTVMDLKPDTRFRRAYICLMRILICRYSTHMTGCSHRASEALFGNGYRSEKRVRVIHNAIDLKRFRDGAASNSNLRQELGLPEGAFLLGHVGTFRRAKNHVFLLRVFQAVRKLRDDAHLALAGDGVLREQIRRECEQLGLSAHVYFLGLRSDVPDVVKQLDVFLFPSLYEGLGVATVEAQVAGTPCVVSDAVPSECDLALGLLRVVPLAAPAETWAREVVSMVTVKRPKSGERERAVKRAGFDAESVARSLYSIYEC